MSALAATPELMVGDEVVGPVVAGLVMEVITVPSGSA
jgi:hypothetical protein